jgi:outer membrane protein insertion porin family
MISYYNSYVGLSPFERFELGGDGLSNQYVGIVGKDIISLRGYTVEQVRADNKVTSDGAAVFTKISMELRYPISSIRPLPYMSLDLSMVEMLGIR